jgi:hypothetical protein
MPSEGHIAEKEREETREGPRDGSLRLENLVGKTDVHHDSFHICLQRRRVVIDSAMDDG